MFWISSRVTELSIVIRVGGVKLTHGGKCFIHSALGQSWLQNSVHMKHMNDWDTTEIHNFFATTIPNTPPVQDTFKYIPGARTMQTRQETLASLLMNDRRNGLPKTRILKRKNKQKETTPRCRSSVGTNSKIEDRELCISVVDLYVPYEPLIWTERIQRSISVLMWSV